jgi:hypothetical protein
MLMEEFSPCQMKVMISYTDVMLVNNSTTVILDTIHCLGVHSTPVLL